MSFVLAMTVVINMITAASTDKISVWVSRVLPCVSTSIITVGYSDCYCCGDRAPTSTGQDAEGCRQNSKMRGRSKKAVLHDAGPGHTWGPVPGSFFRPDKPQQPRKVAGQAGLSEWPLDLQVTELPA